MPEKVVVLTYGPTGIGKTVDQGYSFPNALFAAAPGALESIRTTCGYMPANVNVNTLAEATALLKKYKGKYDTLVIDDFSFMAEQTMAIIEKKKSGFDMWGALRDSVLDFRDQARYCEMNVVLNAWEQAPRTTHKGERVRGGPRLSGNLPEQVPAMCDLVMRAVHDVLRRPWPSVYHCSSDPTWNMKDRLNTAILCHPSPMNLGEILRAAGHSIPRHPDLPKQESQVETLSDAFQDSGPGTARYELANQVYTQLVESGVSAAAARWTLRDALDRATIRSALRQAQGTFIDTTNVPLQ